MDRELIGYTCLFCRNNGKDQICYFDKDELTEELLFFCKDGTEYCIQYNPNFIHDVYKK